MPEIERRISATDAPAMVAGYSEIEGVPSRQSRLSKWQSHREPLAREKAAAETEQEKTVTSGSAPSTEEGTKSTSYMIPEAEITFPDGGLRVSEIVDTADSRRGLLLLGRSGLSFAGLA